MRCLFVVPPIYDFAAYDFWMKPYGFLQLASFLMERGFDIDFFDFTDRNHPDMHSKTGEFGKGKFLRQEVEKPEILSDVKHPFFRYGLSKETFKNRLQSIEKPDFVFVTCAMTYWYLGILEVTEIIREKFPETPLILGGAYVQLCEEHAQTVVKPDFIVDSEFHTLADLLNIDISREDVENTIPAWELYEKLDYGVVKLNLGCPFRCTYCASQVLYPVFRTRPLKTVLAEVDKLVKLGVQDIAFYDDALLVNADEILLPFLREVTKTHKNLRFHTPNAMHARFITPEIAQALKTYGFETIHLGFETADKKRQKETGGKVKSDEFHDAVHNLFAAGFKHKQIITYLLVGLPGQPFEEIISGIQEVSDLGIKVMLADYSPIPHTPLFAEAQKYLNLDDPLMQNTSVFALRYFGEEKLQEIKTLKNTCNAKILRNE